MLNVANDLFAYLLFLSFLKFLFIYLLYFSFQKYDLTVQNVLPLAIIWYEYAFFPSKDILLRARKVLTLMISI